MNKTISLKLTQQEEMFISSMRNKGISPSMLIREAVKKYMQEKDGENMEKGYKEVNQVNQFFQEEEKQDNRKGYNKVNQVNQKVNLEEDFLQEKAVYRPVNRERVSQGVFYDEYINQLHVQTQHLENELDEWKLRYSKEMQYWKETFQAIQTEYQNQVKDSTKRIDDKFDRIMFYFEELRKSPIHTMEISSDTPSDKQKKKWTSQMARM